MAEENSTHRNVYRLSIAAHDRRANAWRDTLAQVSLQAELVEAGRWGDSDMTLWFPHTNRHEERDRLFTFPYRRRCVIILLVPLRPNLIFPLKL